MANDVMLLLQISKPVKQVVTKMQAVLLHSLLVNDFKHSSSSSRTYGVSSIGVEVYAALQGGRNLRRGRNSRQGKAVSDSFRHGDDVRLHSVCLEAPVVGAGPSEPRLHLVGDAQAPVILDVLVDMRQVTVSENNCSTNTLDGLREESSTASAGSRLQHVFHIFSVCGAVVTKPPPVRVRVHHVVDAKALRHRILPSRVRRQAHGSEGHSVVAVSQCYHVIVTRVKPRHQDSQVVRFRARVDEIDGTQVRRQLFGQLLGKVSDLIIEINSCRVLYLLVLLVHGLHQLGVGMPNADRHDPTESVQIPPSRLVIKILLLALNNHYRLLVICEQAWVHKLLSCRQNLFFRRPSVRLRAVREVRQSKLRQGCGRRERQARL
mmetsp:Transcript_15351/g.29618  ORF Transcript_15351/g.29618 Transcript_15351/m.29618 type:complete len:377 (+) Transcript_15351:346-1476(+)